MGKKSEFIPIEPMENLPLVDCHCHLPYDLKKNSANNDQTLHNFFANNGQFLISCSVDKKSLKLIQTFQEKKKNIYLAAGWAPQTVTYMAETQHSKEFKEWLEFLKNNSDDIVAIGEIGLDFHHAKTLEKREKQIAIFQQIVTDTKDLKRPYVIHLRNPSANDVDLKNPQHEFNQPDAVNKIITKIFKEEKIPFNRVMLHCFSGPQDWGAKFASSGYYLSVPSSAYGFKRWRSNIEGIPLENLLTETDSPFQHPYQFGGNNEPANVKYSVAAIAFVNQTQQAKVAEIIIKNAKKFFNISID